MQKEANPQDRGGTCVFPRHLIILKDARAASRSSASQLPQDLRSCAWELQGVSRR